MKNRKIATVLKQLCCIILSLIVISPFYMIVINSFKTKNEAARMSLAFPATWVFTNFGEVIKKGKLVQGFINSLTYAGVATFPVLLCPLWSVLPGQLRYFDQGAEYVTADQHEARYRAGLYECDDSVLCIYDLQLCYDGSGGAG